MLNQLVRLDTRGALHVVGQFSVRDHGVVAARRLDELLSCRPRPHRDPVVAGQRSMVGHQNPTFSIRTVASCSTSSTRAQKSPTVKGNSRLVALVPLPTSIPPSISVTHMSGSLSPSTTSDSWSTSEQP